MTILAGEHTCLKSCITNADCATGKACLGTAVALRTKRIASRTILERAIYIQEVAFVLLLPQGAQFGLSTNVEKITEPAWDKRFRFQNMLNIMVSLSHLLGKAAA